MGGITWTDAVSEMFGRDVDLVFQLTGLHLRDAVKVNGGWLSGRSYKGTVLVVFTQENDPLTTVMTQDEWLARASLGH